MSAEPIRISRSPHRPLHAYAGGRLYWLSAATLRHRPHLRSDTRKQQFVDEMLAAAETWQIEVVAWTLMEHHYHAIVQPADDRGLSRFLGRLHGNTARNINQEEGVSGRQVWRQYWETFLHTEGDYWSRINYMWWNPIRHGFCATPEEWPWTNLHALMADADDTTRAALQRFPAPRRLPGDDL